MEMTMRRLAWQNGKSGMKNYVSMILSLAFTVMIFLNFQVMVYSDLLVSLGEKNQEYVEMIIQALSVVLGFFMVFFIGYATNVFLARRKKEIGIYVFMGLSNQKIAKLYMLEMCMVGIITLAAGMGFGILTTQLFQMILLAMSDISLDIGFSFTWQPLAVTAAFYLAVYLLFVVRGYVNIIRSSVLSLLSAQRQNEYVRQARAVLIIRSLLGIGLLAAGYYTAVKEGGQEVLRNVLLAVILVVAGIYFLFGGLFPLLFQSLARRKRFLYCRERNLWVNQIVFRMKKNYRVYAVVCVLMTCFVTALAAAFAMKGRYEGMVHFRNTYTYQLLSVLPDLEEKAVRAIEQDNGIALHTKIEMLTLADSKVSAGGKTCTLLSYSQLRRLAKEAGLEFACKEPGSREVVEIEHMYLMSFYTKRSGIPVDLLGKRFLQVQAVNEPYLGYLQEMMSFYLVSDAAYRELEPLGQKLYAYNYRIKDTKNYKASLEALGALVSQDADRYTARIVTGPDAGSDMEWVKILYSLGVFLFMVFITASGSILFMKLYNDAFEEQNRYAVLQKIGCSARALRRSAGKELLASYALPFLVMAVSAYFSVHALEKVMFENLMGILFVSIGVIFVFLVCCYFLSLWVYLKNARIVNL